MGSAFALYAKPDVTPHPLEKSSFDPLFGFPNGRKKREMIATKIEMEAAKLLPEERDYCAHELIKYKACRADVFPFVYKCHHEKHNHMNCEYEDYILRMKEYERERRLMERQKRIKRRQNAYN